MNAEAEQNALLLAQIAVLEHEKHDLLGQLHDCQAGAAAAATTAANAAAAQAAAAERQLAKQHKLEKQVAELMDVLRRLERGQGSSAGSTADREVPAAYGAAQLAAAEAGPAAAAAAARAPQPAEGEDGEGAGAVVDELSARMSSVGLGKL